MTMFGPFHRRLSVRAAVLAFAIAIPSSLGAQQLTAPLREGDVAVTGFAGTRLGAQSLPAGVDPTAQAVIDPDGATLRILDLSTLGGPTVGQVVNAPTRLAVPARDIGHVFGLVFDDANNLYAGATSLFGLQIVGDPQADGSPTRLKEGSPRAQFMPGQFGRLPGASPGAIYKIDGQTGAVSVVADTAFSGVANSGPGLGDLAFDPKSKTLYASDLDTGLIHRFDLARNAANLGQFDHGMSGRPGAGLPSLADDGRRADILDAEFRTENPETWGFTQPERRVGALAVHNGRLYYAVAAGPEIWSVSIGPDGAFDTTARRELTVQAEQPFPVTDIAFDAQGQIVIAQRGALNSPFDYGRFTAGNGQVLRYVPAAAGGVGDLWTPAPAEYPIGLADGNRRGAGGVALTRGYNPDGTFGQSCGGTLIATGDDLRNNPAIAAQLPPGPATLHGLQITDAALVAPANVPPAQSAFLAFDATRADAEQRGHVGDVEAVPCPSGAGLGQAGGPGPMPGIPPAVPGPLAGAPGFPAPGGGFGPGPFGGGVDPGAPFPGGGGGLEPFPGGGGGVNPQDPAGGGGQTPSKVNGLEITKSAVSATCSNAGDCEFSISVKNTNATPMPGPIVVNETVSDQNGGLLGTTAISSGPTPPWTCGKQGQTFTCTHPGPIPANSSTTFKIGFKLGQGTAAQQIKNCALLNGGTVPACVSVPLTPPTPQQLLQVAKKADVTQCSDAGGGCAFTISITNPGPAEFNGTFDLLDTPTADGKSLPGFDLSGGGQAIQQDGVTFPLSCKKAGEGLVCNTGVVQAKIPAGKTINIPVTLKPGAGTNAKELKNCAKIKDGGGEACATIPLKNGPLLRANKITAANTCIPKCAFVLQIQNVGNAPAAGPFTLQDVFTPGADLANIETLDGDFGCAKTQGKFVCIAAAKKELKPGEILSGRVVMTNVPEAPEYKNCIEITENPGIPVDKDAPGRCATVKNTAPKQPNLAMKKIAPNAGADGVGSCSLNSSCRFTIELTNNGSATWDGGSLSIEDTIQNGTVESIREGFVGGAEWACTEGSKTNKINCNTFAPIGQAQMKLAPGTTTRLEVAVIAGSTWKKNDILTNCVSHNHADSDFTDNRACASVKLDPFNVKVSKTGDQSCQPGGECKFTITLFNPGPIDHNAPVTISDQLNIGSAPITSITPPIPASICATPPTQIPFTCTSPGDFSLPLGGAPHVFTMTVRLPAGDAAAQFSNCITVAPAGEQAAPVVRATGGTAGDAGSANTACHTVRNADPPSAGGPNMIAPQTPLTTPPPVTPAADKTCFANMVLDASGRCACPPGTQFNGRQCVPFGGGTNPVQPQTPGSGGTNTVPAPRPPAPPIVIACPRGTTGIYPNCRPIGSGGAYPVQPQQSQPVPPTPSSVQPRPVCPPGTFGTYPNCQTGSGGINTTQQPSQSPQQQTCPENTRPLLRRGRIIRCIPTTRPPDNVCPPGTTGRYPRCVPAGGPGSGGINTSKPGDATPPRECPAGTVGRFPRCRPEAKPQECPPGTIGRYPRCRPEVKPRECPAGTIGRYPRCRPVSGPGTGGTNTSKPGETRPDRRECPPGTFGRFPRCRPIATPTPKPTPAPAPKPIPTGPSPKPIPQKCPSGLTGPKCDQIIVR